MSKPRVKAGFICFRSKKNGLPHQAVLVTLLEEKIVTTSRIVAVRPQQNEVETLNTIYEIVMDES